MMLARMAVFAAVIGLAGTSFVAAEVPLESQFLAALD
jgi:hypothetical protein